MWQTPESALEIMKLGLPTHTNQIYDKFIAKDLGCPGAYRAIGVRANDSPIRRYVIDRHSPINNKQKSFYPIFDWTNEDIRNCLKENEVDLPIDYKIWGKSLDGIDYRFIKPMKEHLPEDYDQVKRFFPLVDLEIMRYEQI